MESPEEEKDGVTTNAVEVVEDREETDEPEIQNDQNLQRGIKADM